MFAIRDAIIYLNRVDPVNKRHYNVYQEARKEEYNCRPLVARAHLFSTEMFGHYMRYVPVSEGEAPDGNIEAHVVDGLKAYSGITDSTKLTQIDIHRIFRAHL